MRVAVITHPRAPVTADSLGDVFEAGRRSGVVLCFDEEETRKHGVKPAKGVEVNASDTGDVDLFREWARAVCWKSFEAPTDRKYNCGIVFKRAKDVRRHRRARAGADVVVDDTDRRA